MNYWIRFGCLLTGWNYKILTHCSEASFKCLKKYTSALLILIILWGFTGFCFAERYIEASLWGCILCAFIFIIIVIQIERQIILTVGSNKISATFRLFIAIIMAILGSAIIDQIIFHDDIDRKMVEITDKQVAEQLPIRLKTIDTKIQEYRNEIDTLEHRKEILNSEILKSPTITTISSSTTYTEELQADGSTIKKPTTTIDRNPIPNPRIKQVEDIIKNQEVLRSQQAEFVQKKLNIEENLRQELSSKVGFLDELRAMIEIMKARSEALIFYLIVFSFLISLELFVVSSKLGDSACDYDLIIKHQLKTKERSLEELDNTGKLEY